MRSSKASSRLMRKIRTAAQQVEWGYKRSKLYGWEAKLYDVKPHTLDPVVMVSVTYEEKPYEVE